MPEQIIGGNSGAPMSDGTGGTVEQGNNTQGGGSNTGVNTSNTGGTGSTGNTGGSTGGNTGGSGGATGSGGGSTGGSGNSIIDSLMEIIMIYLAISSMIPSYEDVVEIYLDNKMGFKDLEEKIKETNPDEDPDVIKEKVKEERKNMVEYYTNGPGREDLEKKYNDLKVAVSDSLKSIGQLPKDIAKAAAEAAMPPVLGPVAPNPISTVLKIYNHFSRIKKVVDTIAVSTLVLLTAIKVLGLEKEAFVDKIIVPIKTGLAAIQGQLDKEQEKADKETQDVGDFYITEDPDGNEVTGNDLELIAMNRYEILSTWPLDKESKKRVEKMKNSGKTAENVAWGTLFWDYNKWLIEVEKKPWLVNYNNGQNIPTSIPSYTSGTGIPNYQQPGYYSGPGGPSN